MALSIIGILNCVLVPIVNAETFDIGTRITESDIDLRNMKMIYFDSRSIVYTEPDYKDNITSIFDGNESTGIDHDFGPDHGYVIIELVFPYALNVSNITVKPAFGGGSTNYTFAVNCDGMFSPWFTNKISTEETFQINCTIIGLLLELDNGGTNHFYFNDVIINYTPALSNLDELQDQIDNLTTQLDLLNTRINELNNSINTLNVTPEEINYITDQLNYLNLRINELNYLIGILNVTPEEINYITDQLNYLDLSINELNNSINIMNLTQEGIFMNVTNLFTSYNQFNESFTNFTNDIENLNSCVYQLESENDALKFEVGNLTMELENLTAEIETIKSTEREKIIEKQPDNSLVYGAFILGILGIIIALVAIVLASKKLGSQTPPIDREESKDIINPEKKINEFKK
jgi:prefoldin subunit 5